MTDEAGARAATRAHGGFVAAVVGSGLFTLALSMASPHVPWPTTTDALAARVAFVLAFLWVSAETLAAAVLAKDVSPRRLALTGLVGLVGLGTLAVWGTPSPVMIALVASALLAAGASAGAWVGLRIQHAGHLGVVAIVSSLADVASVFHEAGPTAQILESAPTLSLLTLGAPMLGTSDVPPILGVGDVVMAALYGAAAAKHGLPARRTWLALAAGLAVAMLAVLVLELPLPALPFLGAAMLVAHREARLPPPHERRQAAVALVVLVALVLWLTVGR